MNYTSVYYCITCTKNIFGFPASEGHLSAVNAFHKNSTGYGLSFAYTKEEFIP